MSDVSREEFLEMVKRQDAAEQRDRETSHDIKQTKNDTFEVEKMFKALTGGFKVLQGIGRLARPIGYMAVAIAAEYADRARIAGLTCERAYEGMRKAQAELKR